MRKITSTRPGRLRNNPPLAARLKRYELLNLATQEGIWDHDLRTKESTYNDAMCSLFGYSRREMKDNQAWWKTNIHQNDRERVVQEMREILDSNQPTWYGEYRFRKKDGTYTDVFERLYIVRNGEGKPLRIIGTMQDLSQFKLGYFQVQEERDAHKQQLLRIRIQDEEKEKKEISEELHENINQLLATLRIYIHGSELLNQPTETQNDADSILLDLMRNIRALSQRLFPVGIDILGLQALIEEQLAAIPSSALVTNFEFDKEVEEINEEHKTLLYRIFVEQLQNVLQHAEAKELWVSFKMDNDRVLISIRDDGEGMEPSHLAYRRGMGRIENIIDAFGGEINIITAPGKGFELRVRI